MEVAIGHQFVLRERAIGCQLSPISLWHVNRKSAVVLKHFVVPEDGPYALIPCYGWLGVRGKDGTVLAYTFIEHLIDCPRKGWREET